MSAPADEPRGSSLGERLAAFEREVAALDREARERFGDRAVDAAVALGKAAEALWLLASLARHPVRTARFALRRFRGSSS